MFAIRQPPVWVRALLVTCWVVLLSNAVRAQVAPSTPNSEGLRRFAFIVGVNDGGAERVSLRYAGRDALEFHDVMTRLGGVETADAILMNVGDAAAIRNGFIQLSQRVSRSRSLGQHTEFLFFYSGHSDEQGLRLGDSLLPYRELRNLVQTVGADVQIAVLDSCASGTLTRLKGGKRRAPFLLDLSSNVSGHAFLTSASGDEAAQESDRIQASFFTHYLVTGLRGAADYNSNGRVTLNEAYRFAFDETLARTQDTQAGVQHPAYDIQLVGTGDLVMTDLQATSAGLQLPKNMAGRFFIRDAQGYLVAELFKPGGRSVELALEAGDYGIAVETEAQKLKGRVVLTENNTVALSQDTLLAVNMEVNRTRGTAGPNQPKPSPPIKYRLVPFAAALMSPIDSNEPARHDGAHIVNNAQFNLFWGRTDVLKGLQLGVANHVDDKAQGVQIGLALNSVAGPLRGSQLSGGVNIAYGAKPQGYGGGVDGAQLASGVNLLRGNMWGTQLSGGVNGVDGDLDGFQAAGGVNGVIGNLKGFQAAGGVNFVVGNVHGFQATGGVNFAQSGRIFQAAGGVNATVDLMTGAQIAGGLNYAGELSGLQIAPVNVAVAGHGVQVGVVNILSPGRAFTQIGVFNYADEADVQLGVLSLTRKGGVHPQLWTSTTGEAMFTLRGDANYTYSLLHIGANFGKNSTWNAGLGLGVKLPMRANRLYLEFDVSAYQLHYDGVSAEDSPQLGQARLLMRYQWHPHWGVFGGPTFNALWTHNARAAKLKRPGYGGVNATLGKGDNTVGLWPGFALGMSF